MVGLGREERPSSEQDTTPFGEACFAVDIPRVGQILSLDQVGGTEELRVLGV